jgi:polycomb protein EED
MAALTRLQLLVCRPPGKENTKMQVIQLIIDEDVSYHTSPALWAS